METNYPLIMVFYLDRDMMRNPDIIQPFANSVNDIIAQKNTNAIAFFLPTDGEERIECINPTVVAQADMEKINKMIEDIKTQFSVGDANNNVSETNTSKDCKCNGTGECQCNN